jgi:hypothetical protein
MCSPKAQISMKKKPWFFIRFINYITAKAVGAHIKPTQKPTHMSGQLTPNLVGAYVSYKYSGSFVPRARIQKQNSRYYLCQDYYADTAPDNKWEFKNAWDIGDGSKSAGHAAGVTELTILPESYHMVDGSRPSMDTTPGPTGDKFKLKDTLFKRRKIPKLDMDK